jgi:hypothetical protein
LPERPRRADTERAGEDNRDRRLGIRSPGRMYGDWAPAEHGSHPEADHLTSNSEGAYRPSLVVRPLAVRKKAAMRDADSWYIQDGAEFQSQARPARVVPASGVNEQHIRDSRERAHRRLKQRALAQGEHPRLISLTRRTTDNRCVPVRRRGSPTVVALPAGAGKTALEADEAASHDGGCRPEPRMWRQVGQCLLLDDKLGGGTRPM